MDTISAETRRVPSRHGFPSPARVLSKLRGLFVRRASPGEALLAAGIRPVPPGEFLQEHILAPRRLTAAAAAGAMGLETAAVERVLQGGRVGQEMAESLAKFTGMSAGFWLNLQASADLVARVRA
jgi:addiction module HigA family antidote